MYFCVLRSFICILRVVEKLTSDLENERVRREELEMQVDQLTLKLHQTQRRLERAEEMLRGQVLQVSQVGYSIHILEVVLNKDRGENRIGNTIALLIFVLKHI